VATDDDRIAAHASEIGVEAVMTEASLPSGTDRCRAAAGIAAPDADFIVNLQGDAPFTPPAHVRALIDNAAKGDVVTPVIPLTWAELDRLRERKKMTPFSGTTCIRAADGRAIWFSKTILPAMRAEEKLRKADNVSPVLQHVGLYGYRREALERIAQLPPSRYEELEGLEQLRFIENGLSVLAVDVEASALPSAGIDTPEDAEHAAAMLKTHGDPHFT
jgi:3-deoxy-manno-octulosonate cytidylyltransferase (CMP-KDO synthetase)